MTGMNGGSVNLFSYSPDNYQCSDVVKWRAGETVVERVTVIEFRGNNRTMVHWYWQP